MINSQVPPAGSRIEFGNMLFQMVEAEEMRRSLKRFVVAFWHIIEPSPFVDGWVVDAICDHLSALTRGDIRFLLINVPPRHSKSTICSVLWPVWCWLQKPEDRFLCASYSLDLAIRDNLKKRNLIDSPWFQSLYGKDFNLTADTTSFQVERKFSLTAEQNAKRFFTNDKLGYQLATSVGITTTGQGGSKLLIDDPHSAMEAHSEADRISAANWFRETWSNRMNDAAKDVMIVIGQRIHEEDISGIILKERTDWIHLNLPAEYEPANKCVTIFGWSDPRTEEGELLWPERFSQETLNRYKRDLGSMGFAAQYQQRPVPSGGGQFKKSWLRYFTQDEQAYTLEEPDTRKRFLLNLCHLFVTVDLAISQKQTADYTVIAVWAVTPDRELLLIDRLRDRFDNPEQQKQLQLIYQRYHPDYISIENVAYQLAIIQQLRRLGVPIREYKPVKDKVSRASTASVFYEGGRVYHPKGVSWLQEWEDELLMFPMGAHDDQVDTLSIACDAICGPTANASEQIEAMKRRAQLAQLRTAMPAKVMPGWPG